MTLDKLKQMALTYARAAGASVVALMLAGVTDPKTLVYAFASGFVGPIWKALDSSATEFGRGAK